MPHYSNRKPLVKLGAAPFCARAGRRIHPQRDASHAAYILANHGKHLMKLSPFCKYSFVLFWFAEGKEVDGDISKELVFGFVGAKEGSLTSSWPRCKEEPMLVLRGRAAVEPCKENICCGKRVWRNECVTHLSAEQADLDRGGGRSAFGVTWYACKENAIINLGCGYGTNCNAFLTGEGGDNVADDAAVVAGDGALHALVVAGRRQPTLDLERRYVSCDNISMRELDAV